MRRDNIKKMKEMMDEMRKGKKPSAPKKKAKKEPEAPKDEVEPESEDTPKRKKRVVKKEEE